MTTAAEWVNAALKRFLSQNRLTGNLIDYLRTEIFESISEVFPSQGLFTYPATITPVALPSPEFSLTPDPIRGTDGEGHILELTGATRMNNIPFENTATRLYWLGLHYIEIPSGIYANPRTGVPEYDKYIEEVGEAAAPTAVVAIAGPAATIRVNSILPDTTDATGRVVRVYLVNPVSADPAVAFEDCTVAFVAGQNVITTAGSFGQTVVSTLAANYMVACLGVTIRETAGGAPSPFAADYILLGYITGNAVAPTATVSGQVDLSGGGGHTLQKAYDGLAGSGSGRNITADDQAVRIDQLAASCYEHDIANAALRVQKDNTTDHPSVGFLHDVGIDIPSRIEMSSAILHRVSICDVEAGGAADRLRVQEAVILNSGGALPTSVDFTRGAPLSLTAFGTDAAIIAASTTATDSFDMLEIIGSAAHDGVYRIYTLSSASRMIVRNLDGTNPAFVANEVATGRIFRPQTQIGCRTRAINVLGIEDLMSDWGAPGVLGGTVSVVVPNSRETDAGIRVTSNQSPITKFVRINGDGTLQASHRITTTDLYFNGVIDAGGTASYKVDIPITPFSQEYTPANQWSYIWGSRRLASSNANAVAEIPIRTGSGNGINSIDLIVDPGGAGLMLMELVERSHNFVGPYAVPAETLVASVNSDGTANLQKCVLTPGAPPLVIDCDKSYCVRITSAQVGDHVYSIRMDLNYDVVYPF